jgi:hypothetical protein
MTVPTQSKQFQRKMPVANQILDLIGAINLRDEDSGVTVLMTISKWLFVGGVLCFVLFFLLPGHPSDISLLGWIVFSSAYFVVLAQNYKKKAPVPALGGFVEYKKRPGLYKSIYFLLFFVGAFAVVVLLLINIFDH